MAVDILSQNTDVPTQTAAATAIANLFAKKQQRLTKSWSSTFLTAGVQTADRNPRTVAVSRRPVFGGLPVQGSLPSQGSVLTPISVNMGTNASATASNSAATTPAASKNAVAYDLFHYYYASVKNNRANYAGVSYEDFMKGNGGEWVKLQNAGVTLDMFKKDPNFYLGKANAKGASK